MQYKRLRKRWKSLIALALSVSMAVPVWAGAENKAEADSAVIMEEVTSTEEAEGATPGEPERAVETENEIAVEEIDSFPDFSITEDTVDTSGQEIVLEDTEVYVTEENTETEVEFSYIEVEEIPPLEETVNQTEFPEEAVQEISESAEEVQDDTAEEQQIEMADAAIETAETAEAEEENQGSDQAAAGAARAVKAAVPRVKAGWNLIRGVWYYYNADGTKHKGWVESKGKWYYLDSATGAMVSDEIRTIKGKIYYLKKDGSMALSTWLRRDGFWYYASSDGSFVKGWLQEGGSSYYLDPSTAQMHTRSVVTQGKKKYFVNGSGRMVRNGWGKDQQENWYYAGADGSLLSDWQKINSKWYYMDKTTCIMKKNVILKNGTKRYLMTESGAMAQNDWAEIDHQWYFADKEGGPRTGWIRWRENWYWLGEDGCMQTGWLQVKGETYFTNEEGEIQTGFIDLEGKSYYFREGGQMLKGWVKVKNKYYYAGCDGVLLKSSWLTEDKETYYLGADGVMYTDWQEIEQKWYYFTDEGKMARSTWIESGDKTTWIWVGADGVMATGWTVIEGKYYYMDQEGYMQRGWLQDGENRYYLNEDGTMATGWKSLDDKWYYFKYWGGMATGWVRIGDFYYYCNTDGVMQTGWLTEDGKKYYLDSVGKMAVGWKEVDGYERYFDKWGVMQTDTVIDGKRLDAQGRYIPPAVTAGKKTVKNLLRTAMQPVGNCLYVWGGGHDAYKGGDALRIGVNPKWKTFYTKQGKDYDYTKHRYEYGNGLDCSGFVGWAIYNTMNTKQDYVGGGTTTTSTIFPSFLQKRGWGTYKKTTEAKFKTGDVVSIDGHVWMVIGQCDDGSVVIVHATPPVVQISGTVTPEGKTNSQAVALANKYMKQYYPDAAKKYNLSIGSKSYLFGQGGKGVNRFQWDTASGAVKDPEGYKKMTPEQVLNDLFTGK